MLFNSRPIMNKSLSEYCNSSIQKSIQKMTQPSIILERKIIEKKNTSAFHIDNIYSFFIFLSMSSITYCFYTIFRKDGAKV